MDKIALLLDIKATKIYNQYKEMKAMEIYHAMMTATSDKKSDMSFEVNNFGYYKNTNIAINTLRPNGRADYQIIYADKGYCTLVENGKSLCVDSGSIIIFRPEERQEYTFSANSDYYWIHFSGRDVENTLNNLNLKEKVYKTGSFFEYKVIFDKMIKDNTVNDIATPAMLSAHLVLLLSISARRLYTKDSPIHKVIEKMHTDFSDRLSNEEYAKICGMSEYHFIRQFKRETGHTPLQYKTNMIINKATELLETTNLNVCEIASLLGFEDSLYFSRLFKKHTGVSPKKYTRSV